MGLGFTVGLEGRGSGGACSGVYRGSGAACHSGHRPPSHSPCHQPVGVSLRALALSETCGVGLVKASV